MILVSQFVQMCTNCAALVMQGWRLRHQTTPAPDPALSRRGKVSAPLDVYFYPPNLLCRINPKSSCYPPQISYPHLQVQPTLPGADINLRLPFSPFIQENTKSPIHQYQGRNAANLQPCHHFCFLMRLPSLTSLLPPLWPAFLNPTDDRPGS